MLKISTLFAGVIVSILIFAAVSFAANERAEAPVFIAGESWTFSDGNDMETFLRKEGDTLVFKRESKKSTWEKYRTLEGNLMYDMKAGEQVNTRRPHDGLLAFPMYVGAEWGGPYKSKGIWRTGQYKVVAFEKVTTDAGTFDAFHIKGTNRVDAYYAGVQVDYWYATAVKRIVKMVGQMEAGSNEVAYGWNFSITSYSPSSAVPGK